MQREDPALSPIITWLTDSLNPTGDELRALPLTSRKLWSQREILTLSDNVLVRVNGPKDQLIVPQTLQRRLFDIVHCFLRTLEQLRVMYYWPGMHKDVEGWCKQCS